MEKHFFKFSMVSIAAAIVLVTSGCSGGGSGDSSTSPVSSTTIATGIDGILVGSMACIDVNENDACDAGEPSDITDNLGKFTITSTSTGNLLLVGGKDIGTGLLFTGSLKAPAGSRVVTPLTSAVQALMESGRTQVEAETSIKKALGIDSSVTLTTFDPLDQIENGDATTQGYAKTVLASQAQLQTLVHAVSATVAGARTDATTTIANTMDNVFKEIVKNFHGAIGEVTLTQAQITTVTKTVASVVYADNLAAQVAVKSVAAASAATAVQTATTTKTAIENATAADATTTFNAAITMANTTLQSDVNASSAAAKTAANLLDADEIKAIDDAQKLQEAEEAKIAAATAAATKAAVDLLAAKTAAENDTLNRIKYEAYLAAVAEDARKAAAQAAAEAAAIEAAAKAAQLEADLKADAVAAKALADAALAEAKAKAAADAAAAAARIAAAEKAAADALAEETLEAAQAAEAAVNLSAVIVIAQLETNSFLNDANISVNQAIKDLAGIIAIRDTNATINIALKASASFDANITTASNAVTSADAALSELVIIKGLLNSETNTTIAISHVESAKDFAVAADLQAKIAAGALVGAKQLVLDAQAKQAEAKAEARVAEAIAASRLIVANADSNATADLNMITTYALQAQADSAKTTAIANAYPSSTAASAEKTTAQTAATAATASKTLATTEKAKVTARVTLVNDANVTQTKAATYATEADAAAKIVKAKIVKAETQAGIAATALSAIKGIKTDIENAATAVEGSSTNVNDAINDLETLDTATASLTNTLANIRTAIAGDITNGNKDAILLSALIDIIDVFNSDAVEALVDVTDTNSTLSVTNIMDILADETAKTTAKLASAASSSGGTDVMHTLATKLKTASDTMQTVFASNQNKVISYTPGDANVTITYDDSLVIRAAALSAASALDFVASYNYGDLQTYFATKTKTISSISYEYMQAEIDPLAMMNQSTFFAMNNATRLATAGTYLKSAADLLVLVDPTMVTVDDINATDLEEAANIKAAFEGDGVYSNGEVGLLEKTINLKLIFGSGYIDRNDFTIPTQYTDTSGNPLVSLNRDKSIFHAEPMHGSDLNVYSPADFDVEPKASFEDVITIGQLEKFFEGNTLYCVNDNGDYFDRVFGTDGTFSSSRNGAAPTTGLSYYTHSDGLRLYLQNNVMVDVDYVGELSGTNGHVFNARIFTWNTEYGYYNFVGTKTLHTYTTQTERDADAYMSVPKNASPIANAGVDQSIITNNTVYLNGSNTSDAEGNTIMYSWSITSKPSGSNASIFNNTSVNPTFIPDLQGTYEITLNAKDIDNIGGGTYDTVIITAIDDLIPTANAGIDQKVYIGENVTLDASLSTDDGSIVSYEWKEGSTVLSTAESFVKSDFSVGTHTVTLTVEDNIGQTKTDTVLVTIVNNFTDILPMSEVGGIKSISSFSNNGVTTVTLGAGSQLSFRITNDIAPNRNFTVSSFKIVSTYNGVQTTRATTSDLSLLSDGTLNTSEVISLGYTLTSSQTANYWIGTYTLTDVNTGMTFVNSFTWNGTVY